MFLLNSLLISIFWIFVVPQFSHAGNSLSAHVCRLPIKKGSGPYNLWRFAYDSETEDCIPFQFSGCDGNSNNFGSITECEDRCQSVCRKRGEIGPCVQELPYWTYESGEKKCRNITYGGCQGNGNIFASETACLEKCIKNEVVYQKLSEQLVYPNDRCPTNRMDLVKLGRKYAQVSPYNRCAEPFNKGSSLCGANILAWYYNLIRQKCLPFSYTGCGGTLNNFLSLEECENFCSQYYSEKEKEIVSPSRCNLPPETGDCRADLVQWYMDPITNICKEFRWGGCDEKPSNNFETQEECLTTCLPPKTKTTDLKCPNICYQPKKSGECRASFKRYYYDFRRNACLKFAWGGCDANENNFMTLSACNNCCLAAGQKNLL